jgi:chorismate mutase
MSFTTSHRKEDAMWNDDWKEDLNVCRAQIDKIDLEIIGLVSQRMKICERVGEIKAKQDLPVCMPEREKMVIFTREQWGQAVGLKPMFVRVLFKLFMVYSRMLQKELAGAYQDGFTEVIRGGV